MAEEQAKDQEKMTEERMEAWLYRLLEGVRAAQKAGWPLDPEYVGLADRSTAEDMHPPDVRRVCTFYEAGRGAPIDKGLVVIMADGSEFDVLISKRR